MALGENDNNTGNSPMTSAKVSRRNSYGKMSDNDEGKSSKWDSEYELARPVHRRRANAAAHSECQICLHRNQDISQGLRVPPDMHIQKDPQMKMHSKIANEVSTSKLSLSSICEQIIEKDKSARKSLQNEGIGKNKAIKKHLSLFDRVRAAENRWRNSLRRHLRKSQTEQLEFQSRQTPETILKRKFKDQATNTEHIRKIVKENSSEQDFVNLTPIKVVNVLPIVEIHQHNGSTQSEDLPISCYIPSPRHPLPTPVPSKCHAPLPVVISPRRQLQDRMDHQSPAGTEPSAHSNAEGWLQYLSKSIWGEGGEEGVVNGNEPQVLARGQNRALSAVTGAVTSRVSRNTASTSYEYVHQNMSARASLTDSNHLKPGTSATSSRHSKVNDILGKGPNLVGKLEESQMPADGKFRGKLRYSIDYDFEKASMAVTIHHVESLPAMDIGGTSDPYVKVYLEPDAKKKFSTKVARKTLNAEYNETFNFKVAYSELSSKTLEFMVIDYDRFGSHDIIGRIQENYLGEICLSLRYAPNKNKLSVMVIECKNLKKMDVLGLSDPYVKIYLMQDKKRLEKRKTTTKMKTLNPYYNESFSFEVPPEKMVRVHLLVKVTDYDRVGSNDPIGQVALGAQTGGSQQKQWLDMLATPRRSVAQWHTLAPIEGD